MGNRNVVEIEFGREPRENTPAAAQLRAFMQMSDKTKKKSNEWTDTAKNANTLDQSFFFRQCKDLLNMQQHPELYTGGFDQMTTHHGVSKEDARDEDARDWPRVAERTPVAERTDILKYNSEVAKNKGTARALSNRTSEDRGGLSNA